ncbi:MAG: exodeoxyribonuclease III, partial [Christensenellales bacterium]
ITLKFPNFYLVNCYVPNAQPGLRRLDYRMEFEDDMRRYLVQLSKDRPLIYCGDLNVAHEEIDIKNARSNIGNPGFSYEERGKMTELLNAGFIDSFRKQYPDTVKYSWWSYRGNARKNNTGWRIDYFLLSQSLNAAPYTANIYDDIFGSDHCPVGLDIEI